MPRKTRMYLPDIPCHVITLGNNRDVCDKYQVSAHAYVLMTNHVRLHI